MIIKTAKEMYGIAVEEELMSVMNVISKNKISRRCRVKIELKETLESLKEAEYLVFPDHTYDLDDYYTVQW